MLHWNSVDYHGARRHLGLRNCVSKLSRPGLIALLCVTLGTAASCSASRPAVLVDLDELAISHVCEQPQTYRAYWWLYGSLPLSVPEEYSVSEEPGTLNVIQFHRTTLDYSLTVLLGTLFSITTARMEVRRCVALTESGLKSVQEQRDAALEQERRRKKAERRAREQQEKQEQP